MSEFRERSGGEFLQPIIDELYSKLEPHLLPNRMGELQSTRPTIEVFLKHIKVKEETYQENPNLFREKILLMNGLAVLWEKAKGLGDKKKILLSMRSIWKKSERSRTLLFEDRETNSFGLNPDLEKILLKHYYPESEGVDSWFKDAGVDDDRIVTLKGKFGELIDIQDHFYESLGIGSDDPRYVIAGGWADRDNQVAFVHESRPATSREHERNHIKYPGLLWGELGMSINEGLTELLAQIKIHGKLKFLHRYLHAYGWETLILKKFFDNDPLMKESFINRYKSLDEGPSVTFMVNVVNQIGVEGFINMTRATPFITDNEKGQKLIANSEKLPTSSLYETLIVQ